MVYFCANVLTIHESWYNSYFNLMTDFNSVESISLEACVETFEQAKIAENKGATQIELCGALHLDGLTPDYNLIRKCKEQLNLLIKVMIRPRNGDFQYNAAEIEQMKADIEFCKSIDVHGVVFGCLIGDSIDLALTKELATLSKPLEVTFHKAIDYTNDILVATNQLASLSPLIDSILSSGGANTANEGKDTLMHMINISSGKLHIIPAGKITNLNYQSLHEELGAKSYHGKLIVGQLK